MSDYISREDVLNGRIWVQTSNSSKIVLNGRIWVQTSNGVEISHLQAVPVGYIANLPSADVQPVVHGEWVGARAYCDHLNEEAKVKGKTERYLPSGMMIGVYCNQCWCRADKKSDFCPNCGADMRDIQMSNKDTISRQMAINEANELYDMGDCYCDRASMIGMLNSLPHAQLEQSIAKWQKDFREYINMLNIPRDDYKGIMEYINEVPFAQPEQQWVPCSERLPDKPNVYTVTDHNGKVVRYVFYDNESSRKYWRRCAKAWMPLPSPYQAESEEQK